MKTMFGMRAKSPEEKKAEKIDLDWDAYPTAWTEPLEFYWSRAWRTAMKHGDFDGAKTIFTDPQWTATDRARMLSRPLFAAPDQLPVTEPLAQLLRARLDFEKASEIRGTATADRVDEEAWPQILSLAEVAVQLSQHAFAQTQDPAALVMCQLYGLLAEYDCMSIFHQWHELDPWNLMGWRYLSNASDERWSGDPELQLNLAGYLAESAPEGHPVLGVVLDMLFQRMQYQLIFEETVPSHYFAARREFYADPDIRALVLLAWQRFRSAPDVREAQEICGRFMQALSLAGEDAAAFEAMERSRGYFLPGAPWVIVSKEKESKFFANWWRTITIYSAVAGPETAIAVKRDPTF